MKRLIASLIIGLASFLAHGADCQKTGAVCVDATPCKSISGVTVCLQGVPPPSGGINVAIPCWKYTDTYNCIEPNAVNHCAGLEALVPMCSKTSSVCTQTDATFNTGCMLFQEAYRCSNSAMTTPTNTIRLADTHTLTYDGIDRSACASIDSNPSCTITSHTCVDGPSTKIIDGMPIYKDCWSWKDSYSCVVSSPHDYCMPLKQAGCTAQSSVCTNTALTGDCIEKKFDYLCGDKVDPLPTNVVNLNTTYTIVSDGVNNSQCQSLDNNPNCTLASQTCIDGPSTKNINGLDVYKDCWEWKKEYTCAQTTLTSTCSDLNNNPLCVKTGSTCVDTLPGGQCGLLEHQYNCSVSAPTTSTQTDCGTQTFCVDGTCFDKGYKPDTDFGNAIANMEAMREAANYDIFKGESNFCHSNLLKNCCKSKAGGVGGRNDVIASTLGVTALKAGAETVYIHGSRYIFEGLVNTGSAMLQEYALGALASGTLSMTGSFSVWGAEFAVALDGISFVGFDPWSLAASIAIYVIMDMMQCEQEELMLQMKRGQGLCTKVGSWCSNKVLGVCLTKKESWCCFPSKLGRIVNEQGRVQLGKGWGDQRNPNCSGFTLEELGNLRFDLMNLSEFINDIVPPTMKSPSYAVDRLQQKAQSYYGP